MASSRVMMFEISDERLTDRQNEHVGRIAKEFCGCMADKYIKGQLEHGGNLWELSTLQLVNNAVDEAIDQVVYLLTIRQKLLAEAHANAPNRL